MKIDALNRVFAQKSRVKLYVLAEDLCFSGYVSNPRAAGDGLLVGVGPSARYSFEARELLAEPIDSGTMYLSTDCKLTRRIQTHRRHLKDKGVPEQYLSQAWLCSGTPHTTLNAHRIAAPLCD